MTFLKSLLVALLSVLLVAVLLVAGIGYQADHTVMDAEFVCSELERTDALAIAAGAVAANLSRDAAPLAPAFEAAVRELGPWPQARLREVLFAVMAYVRGETPGLSVSLDTAPLRESLSKNLREHLRNNPPPEIARRPAAERAAALEELQAAILAELALPAVYRIDLASLSAEHREDLQDVRELAGYFRTTYLGAIVAVVVLAALILWLGSVRWLAAALFVYGVTVYLLALFSKGPVFAYALEEAIDLPSSVQVHLPQLYANFMNPLASVGVVCAVAGVVLFAVSFLAASSKRPQASAPGVPRR